MEERHLLQFIRAKTDGVERPLRANTLTNILSVLRRVMELAVERQEIKRNPARNIGRLLQKVGRQQADEVRQVDSWTRDELHTLLAVAEAEEPRFFPLILFLLSTGCRKGEASGLKWEDIDFSDSRVLIRRALVRGKLGTPKSGKARSVVLSAESC